MAEYSQPHVRKRRTSKNSDTWVWQATVNVTDADGKSRQLTKNTPYECAPPRPGEKPSRGRRVEPTGKNAKLAVDFARQWRDGLVAGDAAASADPVGISVVDYVKRYYGTLDVEPGTLDGYRGFLPRIALLDMPIDKLTSTDVQRWVDVLREEGTGTSVLRKTFDQLKYACRYGVRMRELAYNPCDAVKAPRRSETMPNPLDPENVPDLICKLETMRPFDPVTADAALWSLNTGMRRGEVCGLRFRDIDDAIHVNNVVAKASNKNYLKNYPKNRERRVVPLNDTLRSIVERRKAVFGACNADLDDCFFFADPRQPTTFLCIDVLTRRFTSFSKCHGFVGVEGDLLTFHDLRDTFATTALINGVDVVTVAAILGHKSIQTTLKHYAHFLPSKNVATMQMMDGLLNGNAA